VRAFVSKACLVELLVGALGVAEIADGLLILPALFQRLAQTACAGFARLNPALSQLCFHPMEFPPEQIRLAGFCPARLALPATNWTGTQTTEKAVEIRLPPAEKEWW